MKGNGDATLNLIWTWQKNCSVKLLGVLTHFHVLLSTGGVCAKTQNVEDPRRLHHNYTARVKRLKRRFWMLIFTLTFFCLSQWDGVLFSLHILHVPKYVIIGSWLGTVMLWLFQLSCNSLCCNINNQTLHYRACSLNRASWS